MTGILKQLALLFAGAAASVLGGAIVQSPLFDVPKGVAIAVTTLLVVYGSGAISWVCHVYALWKRRSRFLAPQLGILNDMGWDPSNGEIHSWTKVAPFEWKEEMEKQAKQIGVRVKVKLIDVRKGFDSFAAILNPYGGVYPEADVKNFQTLKYILDYVNERGLFVNVADIPGYYAYNPLLRRRLDATPPVYGIQQTDGKIQIIPIRPFEQTPLMNRLGLRVLNVAGERDATPVEWELEFDGTWAELGCAHADKVGVHRAVVVERNVKPIIKAKDGLVEKPVTPLFFVEYGEGEFLISLVFQSYGEANQMKNSDMKRLLVNLLLRSLRQQRTASA